MFPNIETDRIQDKQRQKQRGAKKREKNRVRECENLACGGKRLLYKQPHCIFMPE